MSSRSEILGPDRYFWPIYITDWENTFTFFEGDVSKATGDIVNIQVDPGIYYLHRDTAAHPAPYRSLYLELESELDAVRDDSGNGLNGTYRFGPRDLSDSDLGYSSLLLSQNADPDNEQFGYLFDDADWSMNAGWFGFPREKTDSAVYSVAGSNILNGTVSILGQWQSPKKAAYKTRRNMTADSFESHSGPNSRRNKWLADSQIRMIRYIKINGAHVYRYRARDSGAADEAGLPINDVNNCFEDLWSAMQWGRILGVYDRGDQGNAMQFNAQNPRVNESWQTESQGVDFKQLISRDRKWDGEHLDLEFPAKLYENETVLDGYEH